MNGSWLHERAIEMSKELSVGVNNNDFTETEIIEILSFISSM